MIRWVSVTEMKDFLRDRWRWYAAWVLNRVPRRHQTALDVGKAFHRAMELHLTLGMPPAGAHTVVLQEMQAALDNARREGRYEDADDLLKALREFTQLASHMAAFRDAWKFERTLAIEKPLEGPSLIVRNEKRWRIRGIPDRVVVMQGKTWHVQNRALDGKRNIILYNELLARDMHENLYAWLIQHAYPDWEHGGTLLNVVRKLKAERNPESALWYQQPVGIDSFSVARAVQRARLIAMEMANSEELAEKFGHDALIDNPGLDGGWYGNSRDGYVDVLFGRATLQDDTLFRDREETYGPH